MQPENSLRVKISLCKPFVLMLLLQLLAVSVSFAQDFRQDSLQQAEHFVRNGVVYNYISPVSMQRDGLANAYHSDIHFRLDDVRLDLTYLDNGISFSRLASVIDSIGVGNVLFIDLVSQSSPEGSYRHNKWLTDRRAQVVYDSLLFRYTNLEPLVQIRKIAESWENLRYYVMADPLMGSQSKELVLNVIDSATENPDSAEYRMKNLLGSDSIVGDVYKYLFNTYYPVIRNTGIYIVHIYGKFQPAGFGPVGDLKATIPNIYYPPNEIPQVTVRRPLLAVKTNMLYNSFFTPEMGYAPIWNVELELYPKLNGRWSYMLEYEFPWHSDDSKHQYLQMLNLQLEARRYFKKDGSYSGHYLSVYTMANLYDICFDSQAGSGYQGEGFGAGLGYGYVLPFGKTKRWKAEFFIKGGYYESYYDPYDAGNPYLGKYYYHWFDAPEKFVERNWRLRFLGPTGVGVSLSYDLIFINQKLRK